ncbi:MAG TPA: RNA polymerase sigma factor [Bryobacteraceae bacterium]|nr:RNA polymerase sigma factor [Bryobacteraceae bacterium]
MYNPFVESAGDTPDGELVSQAQSGDREALDRLLTRHHPWIFNIAVRMLGRHSDAEDAAQDILLRAVKSLHSFRGESRFSTWLYRIAANHLSNVKKQRWVASQAVCSFADAAVSLARVPDFDPPDPSTVPVPVELLVREAGIGCMMGTLLCLDGRQRLVFILGEVFGVSDEVGAAILEVTPANFRQILSRARADLYEYLRGNCSLVDPGNTCKCVRKTRAFIQGGFVDPQNLQFTADHLRKVREVADERAEEWSDAYMRLAASLYRGHPFYQPADQVEILRKALPFIPLGPMA